MNLLNAERLGLGAALGAVAGSFVATAVLRRLRGVPAIAGRSACDHCGANLSYVATLPVVSYAVRGGACVACSGPIDATHLWGELLGAAVGLSVAAAAAFGHANVLTVVSLTGLGFALLALSLYDLRTQRIPDALTGVVLVAGLGFTVATGDLVSLASHLAWGATLFLGLRLVRTLFRHKAGKDGLGFGDVKLIGALAVACGSLSLWMMTGACVLALAVRGLRRTGPERFAFGPYLAASGWIAVFVSDWGPWRG